MRNGAPEPADRHWTGRLRVATTRPCTYPSLLDFPAPGVLAYPREAVVAEKLEAMLVLGDRNSRIKDFFDLYHLVSHFAFDRAELAEAVQRTFAQRLTPITAEPPIGLTPAYWENPSRPAQIRAYARRAGLDVPDDPGEEFVGLLGAFLLPPDTRTHLLSLVAALIGGSAAGSGIAGAINLVTAGKRGRALQITAVAALGFAGAVRLFVSGDPDLVTNDTPGAVALVVGAVVAWGRLR